MILSQQKSMYLLSIAEKIIHKSCPQQVFMKYDEIKSSLTKQAKSYLSQKSIQSKQLIKTFQQTQKKLKSQRNSCINQSRKSKRQKSGEIIPKTAYKLTSNNNLQYLLRSNQNTKKYSINTSGLKKQNSSAVLSRKISSNKQNKLIHKDRQQINKEKSTHKDRSSINKTYSKSSTNENPLITKTKIKKYQISNQKPAFPSQIIARRLFEDKLNQDLSTFDNQISFNLNLNKLLNKVNTIIDGDNKNPKNKDKSKKQSKLSQQNLNLLTKIAKKINLEHSTTYMSDFKKTKQGNNNINERLQNSQAHSNIFTTINLNDQSSKTQITQKKSDFINEEQLVNSSNKNQTQQKISDRNNRSQKQKQLKSRMKQIKKDNKWLIEHVQKLLIQNSQLKRLLTGSI